MQRNVMISGHDDLRFRQSIEERARLLKLVRTCALGEIAGDCNEVRFDFADDLFQRIDQQRVYAPKVQVRQMNYGSHTSQRAFTSWGTITRSARLRTRY